MGSGLSTAQQDLHTLLGTRAQLTALIGSLNSLRRDVETAQTLPAWPSLASSLGLVSHQLLTLSTFLDSHRDFIAVAKAHPLPSFDGIAHKGMVETLLRKRPEPAVVAWKEEGENFARRAFAVNDARNLAGWNSSTNGGSNVKLDGKVDVESMDRAEKLWQWAQEHAISVVEEVPWGIDLTVHELGEDQDEDDDDDVDMDTDNIKEQVRLGAGLSRKLNIGDEDDEPDDEGKGKDAKTAEKDASQPASASVPATLDELYRFMGTGSGLRNR